MSLATYYVYALKDPRKSPAMPFYIGKGTGTRAYDHLVSPDDSLKGKRIRDIQDEGLEVLVTTLIDAVDETMALKLEAELVSAFGTEATGGLLTNAVIPQGNRPKLRSDLVVPSGAAERAQLGLSMLKSAVLELAKANSTGITNADTAKALGIQSDYGGGSKDYLSYSLLGLLMREGSIKRSGRRHQATIR